MLTNNQFIYLKTEPEPTTIEPSAKQIKIQDVHAQQDEDEHDHVTSEPISNVEPSPEREPTSAEPIPSKEPSAEVG